MNQIDIDEHFGAVDWKFDRLKTMHRMVLRITRHWYKTEDKLKKSMLHWLKYFDDIRPPVGKECVKCSEVHPMIDFVWNESTLELAFNWIDMVRELRIRKRLGIQWVGISN